MEHEQELELRRSAIRAHTQFFKQQGMEFVPIGLTVRGPGAGLPTEDAPKALPLRYGGDYPALGLLLSFATTRGEDVPDWILDIIRRIEIYALSQFSSVNDWIEDDREEEEYTMPL